MPDASAVAVAQPFLAAVTETFQGLLGIDAVGALVPSDEGEDPAAREGMTALIEFGGPRFGVAIVTFPSKVAHAVVERMLSGAGGAEDGDVSDGVGEIVNIIAGRAKAVLSALGFGALEMGVPTVVKGFSLADLGLEGGEWSRVDFETELGRFTLRVAFARPDVRPIRVLLADDSRVMRKIERAALLGLGPIVEFVEAANGREAVDRVHASPDALDLIVVDVKMPEVDGIEAVAKIRVDERARRIPVLVVSSLARSETEARFLAASPEGSGALSFVSKPFEKDALLGAARALIEGPTS